MIRAIGYVLNVKDVINDAHNTFIKDNSKDQDQDTQMEDILRDKAFNWSDEDLADIESKKRQGDATKIMKK